jgi:hypothetical protein
MTYLPTLTLNYIAGETNSYRIHNARVEFQPGDGTWGVLDNEDVQLHFWLNTEASKWLLKYPTDLERTGQSVSKSPRRLYFFSSL